MACGAARGTTRHRGALARTTPSCQGAPVHLPPPMDLRETLNLPDAAFTIPMKANLPALEPEIQDRWEMMGVYELIQDRRRDAPVFVLHDGPPYTNGPVHMGTALNKLLKDFVVKSRTMMGFRSPYVPGYDNHGLPIEQAVMKEFRARGIVPTVVELRKACREHARGFIQVQTSQFKRLGIFGMWDKPYATMDYKFEAGIIRVFRRMVEKGYVYRGLRPTLWSPTQQTALADTEIVYEDHVSKAIYVRFPLKSDPNKVFQEYPNLFAVIWTTTPWTLPGNLAVAFHPELTYAIVEVGHEHYLVLDSLVQKLAHLFGWKGHRIVARMDGITFDHAVFAHPVFGRESLAVMAEYVTAEEGTGVVHTAPGHGRDDFNTGRKYGLPAFCPVDERGILTEEALEFAGISYKECDTVVVSRLREVGHLLREDDHTHSYPHSERDGKPVIFRTTEQWFVSMDHDELRTRMLAEIGKVSWHPQSGFNRIEAMVRTRPDWCISRQRPWGVGIPVFYGRDSKEPVLDPKAIDSVADLVAREGSDAWFEKDPSSILPAGYAHPKTGEKSFVKEVDVLDVWFDSGSTSLCVLEGEVESRWKERWPADLYLEGSDQHRGWFNSSLVIGTAVKGGAPYKAVLTHGFVDDEHGRKMSKRLGNVLDPEAVSETHGADVLRYWVASVDWQNDAPCSEGLLKQFGENYRTVRNTIRFLLGNLSDYNPAAAVAELLDLDRWIIEQTELLVGDCVEAYAEYDFGFVVNAVHNFCAKELSRFYLDAIKDRMYCDGKDWNSRRSAQYASHFVALNITRLMAPILAHTCEEAYGRIPQSNPLETVHAELFEAPSQERRDEIRGNELELRFAALLSARSDVFAAFEAWKAGAEVKDSQDAIVTIATDPDTAALLLSFGEDLPNLFKFSSVEVLAGSHSISFAKSPFAKCERSRLRRPDVAEVVWEGRKVPLTARDRKVLGL